mmetsp:Transcript_150551/g.382810  ORF Transcript_150551/g.382810 Transcript_150551/m.382810 type:complete len:790 (+) Transcript_150551:46-2415(+)
MDSYERLQVLGQGSYGVAVLVRRRTPLSETEAPAHVIKEIDLSQMSKRARREARTEVEVLRSLSHINVVAYIDTFWEFEKLCIAMEFADAGDLAAELRRRKNACTAVSDSEALAIFAQCCLGLQHTHSKHILHRDLKSQNIFLTRGGIVKIGDYGIAKVLDHTTAKVKTKVGTPYYTAPEVVDSSEYGLKADVWSLGVVMYEVLALQLPFQASSLVCLVLQIIGAEPQPLPDTRDEELRDIVRLALHKQPESRPSCEGFLARPKVRQVAMAGSLFRPMVGSQQTPAKPSAVILPAPAAASDLEAAAIAGVEGAATPPPPPLLASGDVTIKTPQTPTGSSHELPTNARKLSKRPCLTHELLEAPGLSRGPDGTNAGGQIVVCNPATPSLIDSDFGLASAAGVALLKGDPYPSHLLSQIGKGLPADPAEAVEELLLLLASPSASQRSPLQRTSSSASAPASGTAAVIIALQEASENGMAFADVDVERQSEKPQGEVRMATGEDAHAAQKREEMRLHNLILHQQLLQPPRTGSGHNSRGTCTSASKTHDSQGRLQKCAGAPHASWSNEPLMPNTLAWSKNKLSQRSDDCRVEGSTLRDKETIMYRDASPRRRKLCRLRMQRHVQAADYSQGLNLTACPANTDGSSEKSIAHSITMGFLEQALVPLPEDGAFASRLGAPVGMLSQREVLPGSVPQDDDLGCSACRPKTPMHLAAAYMSAPGLQKSPLASLDRPTSSGSLDKDCGVAKGAKTLRIVSTPDAPQGYRAKAARHRAASSGSLGASCLPGIVLRSRC